MESQSNTAQEYGGGLWTIACKISVLLATTRTYSKSVKLLSTQRPGKLSWIFPAHWPTIDSLHHLPLNWFPNSEGFCLHSPGKIPPLATARGWTGKGILAYCFHSLLPYQINPIYAWLFQCKSIKFCYLRKCTHGRNAVTRDFFVALGNIFCWWQGFFSLNVKLESELLSSCQQW